MKLLANENFPFSSVNVLRDAGFDIKAVGIECFGIRDEEVIGFAQEENRTILTFDRDYGELIFKKRFKPEKGLIYLRWNDYEPEEKLLQYCIMNNK